MVVDGKIARAVIPAGPREARRHGRQHAAPPRPPHRHARRPRL